MALRQPTPGGAKRRERIAQKTVGVLRVAPSRSVHPEGEHVAVRLQVVPGVEPIGQRAQFFHA
ncbi:hypothetical protein AB0F18_11330 [Streptomyces sp. NPDC029216]|uniref:hypothetical protein n=1 Tax=Streptomyces sp. NPDC029216 TaxID=3154701 RepID=UPI00340E219B